MAMTMTLAMVSILTTTVSQAMIAHGMTRVGGLLFPIDELLKSMQKAATDPWIIGGLILVTVAVPLWLEVLARLPLSIAYPLVSVGFIFTLVLGAVFLKEPITPLKIVGVLTIIGGVVALSKG